MIEILKKTPVRECTTELLSELKHKIESILNNVVNYAEGSDVESLKQLNFVNGQVKLQGFDSEHVFTADELLNGPVGNDVLYADNVHTCLHYILYCFGDDDWEAEEYLGNFDLNSSMYDVIDQTIDQVALSGDKERVWSLLS